MQSSRPGTQPRIQGHIELQPHQHSATHIAPSCGLHEATNPVRFGVDPQNRWFPAKGTKVRRHGVAVFGQYPCYRAARTTGHALQTYANPTTQPMTMQSSSPAHTPEHKSTWDHSHTNTLPPISPLPAACKTLQTAVSIGLELPKGRPGFRFRGGGGGRYSPPARPPPPPKRAQLTGLAKSHRV